MENYISIDTKSGFVKLLSSYGHGKGKGVNPRRPAIVHCDDGDGHYEDWSFTGKMEDAIYTLAWLALEDDHCGRVAHRDGNGFYLDEAPDDFWIEQDGDFAANIEKYPEIIAW